MSFITKRERVFDPYDLYDLPSRNEGKLKAYASCTDARAWSHFCSDKTEHLVEIIKRNNEVYPGKFIPMNVIIDLMMASKNAEIRRLKRKLIQFEQLLAVYDELELNCDQKCEIQNAHAMIKEANRELEDVDLHLDISGWTEIIDSEDFATGKSRGDALISGRSKFSEPAMPIIKSRDTSKSGGDEWISDAESIHEKDLKSKKGESASRMSCFCDVSTSPHDPRIGEMQEALINKDARLSALQNTIAVLENDVCEPYCIYAHIYTALEKIFATLRQVDKYRLYLDLMSTGKDIRCIDIKGKILFKLKVLEKFCIALIAPCSERFAHDETCECYRAEITHIATTFAITSSEAKSDSLDSKRAHLVADIMEHDEMRDLLGKESTSADVKEAEQDIGLDTYSIHKENLNRLKNLQINYNDLMFCYENLKHDRNNLSLRCQQYEDLERECNALKDQLREYTALYNERDHYRKRSEDLDSLKEQYIVLSDETTSLETQLKAEMEINSIKSNTIEDLRNNNIELEKRLNDALISYEKEKNTLQCKLKETECKVMCQVQQIRSLSNQIDRLLEQEPDKQSEDVSKSMAILDEIETLKDQIRAIKEALCNSEEEKLQLQCQFQEQLQNVNDLKIEIEEWKSTCEKALQRNDYLEQNTVNIREVQKLFEENKNLSIELQDKTTAVANLINVLNNKSLEVKNLRDEADQTKKENAELYKQLQDTKQKFGSNMLELENEKQEVLSSLQLARQESQELLQKVKDYDELVHKKEDLSKSLVSQEQEYNEMKEILMDTIEENKKLQLDLTNQEKNNAILLQELQRLRDVHQYAIDSINNLQEEKHEYKLSLELTKKESESLEEKLKQFEGLKEHVETLKQSHEKLQAENHKLASDLIEKTAELVDTVNSVELTKKESKKLLEKVQQSENLKDDMIKLSADYKNLMLEKESLLKELADKNKDLENLLQTLSKLKSENEELLMKSKQISDLEQKIADSKKSYNELLAEKNLLQTDFDSKTKEINNLYNTLESKIEENKFLQYHHTEAQSNIAALHDENINAQTTLKAVRRESQALMDKLKEYDILLNEYDKLKKAHDQIHKEKDRLLGEFEIQLKDLGRLEMENRELNNHSLNLTTHNEDLERALIDARTELARKPSEQPAYLDIKKEIEEMKTEKLNSHKKIKNLLDKIDESDNIISNLTEDILERDDKIAILQNHINLLEDEVRRLLANLAEVINAGEGIKYSGYQRIDQSISQLEAHHSKATHNMKMEIARLQHANSSMEQQLSRASDESIRTKQSHTSRILQLQNEREIIVNDIKQLEIMGVGDSALIPDQSNLSEVLTSLDRVKKHVDAKNSQCAALEQTLLKVQTSSQLLLSKADEAKRIVEKEKQKIINEKEEAIADRLNMEKQLLDLKENLDKQTNHDKAIIKDLEGEVWNQKLIIDKINDSTQNYISKLEEEMQSMQKLYKNSLAKINELQDKLKNISHENAHNETIIYKLQEDLDQKSKEAATVLKELHEIKNKSKTDFKSQAGTSKADFMNESSQTDKIKYMDDIGYNDKSNSQKIEDVEVMKVKKATKQIPQSFNEVQILTANIEPTFDFVKNTYLTYKLKQLGTCRLEQYSITDVENNFPEQNLVDIFSRQSDMQTVSSKVMGNLDEQSSKHPQSGLSTLGSDLLSNPFILSTSEKSEDKDLFLIYKDSDGSRAEKEFDNKDTWSHDASSSRPEINVRNPKKITRMGFMPPNLFQNNSRDKLISENQNQASDESYNIDPKDGIDRKEPKIESKVDQDNNATPRKGFRSGRLMLRAAPTPMMRAAPPMMQATPPMMKAFNYPRDVNGGPEKEPNNEFHENLYPDNDDDDDDDYEKKEFTEGVKNIRIAQTLRGSIPIRASKFPQENNQTKDSDKEAHLMSQQSWLPINDSNIKDTDEHKPDHKLNRYADDNHSRIIGVIKSDSDGGNQMERNKRKYAKDDSRRIKNLQNDDFSTLDVEDSKPDPDRYFDKFGIENAEDDKGFNKVPIVNQAKQANPFSEKVEKSHHQLSRVGADVLIFKNENGTNDRPPKTQLGSFGLEYIMDTVKRELEPNNVNRNSQVRRTRSVEYNMFSGVSESSPGISADKMISSFSGSPSNESPSKSVTEQSVMVNIDTTEDYENKIRLLSKALESIEKDYKKKIDAIKVQYDGHIKSIINEHNQGVKSIQSLHEETLQDVIKSHENEVENLRTMSIEALRRAEKLEKENRMLKSKLHETSKSLAEEPIKICTPDIKRRKSRSRGDMKMLTKTNVEAFNVKPKMKNHGPCTCSLDVNVSDTIRNIFEQVDVEQRKLAEHAYMKYIANKMYSATVEALDAQELSFLHFKVCRVWKSKMSKEEALQKKIDSLESELMNKQRHAQQHIAELDRKVAEERRRLQEVREAVCRSSHNSPTGTSPAGVSSSSTSPTGTIVTDVSQVRAIMDDCGCGCSRTTVDIGERRSAGDLVPGMASSNIRPPVVRVKQNDMNRGMLAKLDVEERKEKKLYDEPPTRLRRAHDRITNRKK